MQTITDPSGAVTAYTSDGRGYVVLARNPRTYEQYQGLFVQPTMVRLNVNVVPMLPAECQTRDTGGLR